MAATGIEICIQQDVLVSRPWPMMNHSRLDH
jgi:hypothetical protein